MIGTAVTPQARRRIEEGDPDAHGSPLRFGPTKAGSPRRSHPIAVPKSSQPAAYDLLEPTLEETGTGGNRERSECGKSGSFVRLTLTVAGIISYFSRTPRWTISRFQPEPFGDFLLPLWPSVRAPSLYAPAERFQLSAVVGLIHPLDPSPWHLDRPTRQQRHFRPFPSKA